jgi:oligopeptide transport system substrate-binding protein
MKKLSLVSLAFLLFALAALTGCSNDEAGSASGENEVEQVLNANLGGEPYTLDPAFASDTTSFWVIDNLYEGLYRYDKDGNAVEGAASKVDVSDDGKVYTFTIRDGQKWSNGDPLTAKDFEFAWKRVLNPETGAYDPSSFFYIKGAEEYNRGNGAVEDVGITAEDDRTLKVELNTPIKFFPKVLMGQGFMPVNQKTVEADENWAAGPETIVTNGAYTLGEWEHNNLLTLKKNSNYWNSKDITMDTVNFKMVADANTEYQMYKSGDIDLIKNLAADAIDMEKGGKEFINSPQFSVYTYTFNVNEEPFNNSKIRKAFSMAIDREAITKNISKGGEEPAYGYVGYGVEGPSGKDFRDEKDPYYSFDADEAKALLAEGMKEEGWKELPAVTLKYNSEGNHKKIAEALQEMFKVNLGVEVKLENQEWKTFIDTFKQKNFQAARMGWVGDFLDPYPVLDLYSSGSSSNFTNWSNPEFDQLLDQSLTEQDEAKRFELLHQAEAVLMDEMPIIPIYFSSQNAVVKENIKGIRFSPLNNPDFRYAEKVSE